MASGSEYPDLQLVQPSKCLGVVLLLLSTLVAGFLTAIVCSAVLAPNTLLGRSLQIAGFLVAGPGLYALAATALAVSRSHFGETNSHIRLNPNSLTCHHNVILNEPLDLPRNSIRAIEPATTVDPQQVYSGEAFAPENTGPVLDLDCRPNAVVRFHHPRQFQQARNIWPVLATIPLGPSHRPIEPTILADKLFLRLADPDQDIRILRHWLGIKERPSPPLTVGDPLTRSTTLMQTAKIFATTIGCVLFVAGFYTMALAA